MNKYPEVKFNSVEEKRDDGSVRGELQIGEVRSGFSICADVFETLEHPEDVFFVTINLISNAMRKAREQYRELHPEEFQS